MAPAGSRLEGTAGARAVLRGKGPERTRTRLADDDVFVVMGGGLTRNQETLLAAGDGEAVRQYRAVRDAGARRRYAAPMRALAVGPLAGAAVGHRDRLTVFRVLWWAIR